MGRTPEKKKAPEKGTPSKRTPENKRTPEKRTPEKTKIESQRDFDAGSGRTFLIVDEGEVIHGRLTIPPDSTPSLEAINYQNTRKCWIKAQEGSKKDEAWVPITEQGMLDFVCMGWAMDCNLFLVLHQDEDKPSPNTKPPNNRMTKKIQDHIDSSAGNEEDPISYKCVSEIPDDLKVKVTTDKCCLLMSATDLVEYLEKQVKNGKCLVEVDLVTMEASRVVFTADIWFCCLFRKNSAASSFREMFQASVLNILARCKALARLRDDHRLTKTLVLYVSDLFRMSEDSAFITNFPAGNGQTFEERLEALVQEQQDECEICTAHTLAPFFCRFFHLIDDNAVYVVDPSLGMTRLSTSPIACAAQISVNQNRLELEHATTTSQALVTGRSSAFFWMVLELRLVVETTHEPLRSTVAPSCYCTSYQSLQAVLTVVYDRRWMAASRDSLVEALYCPVREGKLEKCIGYAERL